MSNQNYYQKYLKYKQKYINLKSNDIILQGGGKKIVIHISGPSGAGKTTLGNKLQEKFGNKIVVKDLDNLRDEHINKTYDTSKGWSVDEVKYQKFIDDYISKQNKPIIFVYSPPKVGSTSLISTFRLFFIHSHNIIHIHDEEMLKVLFNVNIEINELIYFNKYLNKNNDTNHCFIFKDQGSIKKSVKQISRMLKYNSDFWNVVVFLIISLFFSSRLVAARRTAQAYIYTIHTMRHTRLSRGC